MADINELDDFGKKEVLLRIKLDITRISGQIEENEFKIFEMEKRSRDLKQSISDAKAAIDEKKAELKKHEEIFGIKI